jgi:RNA polymerase sigma factor (sigma-70 family)
MGTMDQLIEVHYKKIRQASRAEARRWYTKSQDYDDIIQSTFLNMVIYPVEQEGIRDMARYVNTVARQRASRILYDHVGFDHHKEGKLTQKAEGRSKTFPVGLYQPTNSDEVNYLDERILPPMASAEDVFFASLPSKKQELLRKEIEKLAPRQREALTLRFYEEMEVPAIAEYMQLTYDQASRAIAEGLRTLRKRLNPGQVGYPKAVVSNGRGKKDV